YPNPASEMVWIDWPGASDNATILVLDVSGKKVLQQAYSFHQQIDVQRLNSGIYMLVLEDGGARKTGKFIVR
ncbi:MAG: T9SS type A sorting domain-containing protein, partial [Flavobacteriales bacterium]